MKTYAQMVRFVSWGDESFAISALIVLPEDVQMRFVSSQTKLLAFSGTRFIA